MTIPLAERLRGVREPAGYVSFRSALVHHGLLTDSLAVIQVASPELCGRDSRIVPGPVEFVPVPRALYFGWRSERFEGELVPLATPEKAVIDWLGWAEERGFDAHLEELEWDRVDKAALRRLAAECGVCLRAHLPRLRAARSVHEQERMRIQALGDLLA